MELHKLVHILQKWSKQQEEQAPSGLGGFSGQGYRLSESLPAPSVGSVPQRQSIPQQTIPQQGEQGADQLFLQELLKMGFPEEKVIRALQATKSISIDAAVDWNATIKLNILIILGLLLIQMTHLLQTLFQLFMMWKCPRCQKIKEFQNKKSLLLPKLCPWDSLKYT